MTMTTKTMTTINTFDIYKFIIPKWILHTPHIIKKAPIETSNCGGLLEMFRTCGHIPVPRGAMGLFTESHFYNGELLSEINIYNSFNVYIIENFCLFLFII